MKLFMLRVTGCSDGKWSACGWRTGSWVQHRGGFSAVSNPGDASVFVAHEAADSIVDKLRAEFAPVTLKVITFSEDS